MTWDAQSCVCCDFLAAGMTKVRERCYTLCSVCTTDQQRSEQSHASGARARLKTFNAPSVSTCHKRTVLSRLAESRNRLLLHDRSKMSSSWPQNSRTGCGWKGSAASLQVDPSDLLSLFMERSADKPGSRSAAHSCQLNASREAVSASLACTSTESEAAIAVSMRGGSALLCAGGQNDQTQ